MTRADHFEKAIRDHLDRVSGPLATRDYVLSVAEMTGVAGELNAMLLIDEHFQLALDTAPTKEAKDD